MKIDRFSAATPAILVPVALTATASAPLPGIGNAIRVVNEGPNTVYIAVGAGAQAATVPTAVASGSSTPIRPLSEATFSIPAAARQNFSMICGTGSANVVLQVGEGS